MSRDDPNGPEAQAWRAARGLPIDDNDEEAWAPLLSAHPEPTDQHIRMATRSTLLMIGGILLLIALMALTSWADSSAGY